MHRGMTLAIGLTIAATVASPSLAQQGPGPLTLSAHPIRGGVYWVSGGASNAGFIVGDNGVVVFDAQTSPEAAQMQLAEIAKITPKPVNIVVLSHADPDHVAGLPAYPAGRAIIAQENTKSEMMVSAADPNAAPRYRAIYGTLVASYLPTQTIGSTQAMVLDGVPTVLMYVAPAHTSGDLILYLPKQKVVFAGDIITTNTGRFPVIHLGGSSLGWIASMHAILALDADIYVSGHGGVESKDRLEARLRDVEERRAQIKAMVDANKSLAEIEQALPDPGYNPMFEPFAQTVYTELTKGYPPASPPWYNIVHK